MSTLSLADLTKRVADTFLAHGCSHEAAASVARALVTAEADGLKGHGLSRVPTYLAMVKSGKIDGKAKPKATNPRPSVLSIDAAKGFAYPAIDLALAELSHYRKDDRDGQIRFFVHGKEDFVFRIVLAAEAGEVFERGKIDAVYRFQDANGRGKLR